MKTCRLAATVVAGMVWSGAPAWADDAPKWGAHVDLEGRLGTKRNLGEVGLFLPLAQDAATLLFADMRTRMDDEESREGNFGLGLRHMLDAGWNLGGYGYVDRRRSEYRNYFNQVTLGAEALSLDWDLRANGYFPVGRTRRDEDSLNTADISGTSVIFQGGEERALGGFDAEIGWRVPLFEAEAGQQLRVYGGGYRFADDGVPMVAGPRGRAEMVFDEVPGLWDGSRLSLGAEWQRDAPRGSQGFLSARLRIPLQSEASPSRLTALERRMTDPIVRDVDIIAQAGRFSAPEKATQLADGTAFTVINSLSTNGAALPGAVAALPAGSTALLAGTFNTANTVAVSGKTLVAGRQSVRSPSGRIATLNSPATISSAGGVSYTIMVSSNSTVSGLTIAGMGAGATAYGIGLNTGARNIVISNNVITMTQTGASTILGIADDGNDNVTIRGNRVTVVGAPGWTATGISLVSASTNVTVSDNTVKVTGGLANRAFDLGGVALRAGSTGNVVTGTVNGFPVSGLLGYAASP